MFAIVVHGRATSGDDADRAWRHVEAALDTTATRWLGSMGALLPSDDFVAILAFESREAGRISMGDLTAASAWQPLTDACDNLSFHECSHVRALGLHDAGMVDEVEVACGSVTDIDALAEAFERAVGDGAPAASGVLCWNDDLFAAVAIQGGRGGVSVPGAPGPALERARGAFLAGRTAPAVADPLFVLRLGGRS